MKKIEKDLYNLNKLKPLSSESRKAYDDTYQYILATTQETTKKRKRIVRYKPYLVIITILFISLIFTISPVSKAISNFLNLFNSNSITLRKNGFVTKQGGTNIDRKINVTLEELYNDQQETGFHFKVKLPENSKLLKANLDEFTLNFSLVDQHGKNIMDLNSKKISTESTKNIANYTGESYIDRDEKQIEFVYKFHTKVPQNNELKNAHILVTKISGTDSTKKMPGQHLESQKKEDAYETVQGSWKIPIKSDQIKEFQTLKFVPVDNNYVRDISASVTPTSVTVDVKVSSGIGKGGTPDNMWLSQANHQQHFKWREATTQKIGNDKIYRIIFDYPNYDSNESITVHFPDQNIELKMLN